MNTSFEWTSRSTKVLLQLCLKEFVWAPQKGKRTARIVSSMRSIGFQVSPSDCKTRLTGLLGTYCELKVNHNKARKPLDPIYVALIKKIIRAAKLPCAALVKSLFKGVYVQTFRWSDEAVRNLIRVWGDVYGKNKEKSPKMLLHKGFAGRRRCKEISKTLCELGIRVTASQCRYRIFQLIKQFRKVARKDVSSMSSDSWKFYGDVRSIVESAGIRIAEHKKWSDKEVKDLLHFWKKYYVLAKEESKKKGFRIIKITYTQYKCIGKSLHELGHKVTSKQCMDKIRVLAHYYRRMAKGESFPDHSDAVKYYKEVQAIIGDVAKLKKVKWSDKATKDLISAWGQSHAKSKEKMQKRRLQNAAVSCIEYESISKTLHELGYNFTKRQCVQKVARLAYLYKRVSSGKDKIPDGIGVMKYYKELRAICGDSAERSETKRWCDEAVIDLVPVWGSVYARVKEEKLKQGLKAVKLSYADYASIAKTLLEMGHDFSPKQCHKKIEKVIFDYRRISSGSDYVPDNISLKCYKELQAILGDVQKPCKRRIWSDEAVRDLISVCGNYTKIRDSPSTTGLCIVRRVYVDIQDVCKALRELGHNFTAEQCKAKKTNLINQYKQIARGEVIFSDSNDTMKYYKEISAMIENAEQVNHRRQCCEFESENALLEAGSVESSSEQSKHEIDPQICRFAPTFRWSKEATKDLVHIWGKVLTEIKEEKQSHLGQVGHQRIHNALGELGHSVTLTQCRYKINSLTALCKKVINGEISINRTKLAEHFDYIVAILNPKVGRNGISDYCLKDAPRSSLDWKSQNESPYSDRDTSTRGECVDSV